MDLLDNICIPDSPNSVLPDDLMQATTDMQDTTDTTEAKSPNSKRRLIIKKKSPSIQSLSSYLAEEEPEGIGKIRVLIKLQILINFCSLT